MHHSSTAKNQDLEEEALFTFVASFLKEQQQPVAAAAPPHIS
jgi:hypothetical protein